jgi:transcriptional regulator with XRE-family HTH domain
LHEVSDSDTRRDVSSTGNRIQARREELGLTREQLAEKLETTRMTVWRVENGKQGVDADDLKKWAKALKTQPAELLA